MDRHRTSAVVLLAYVLSGFLIEVTHHDASEFRLPATETITSHDCGENEVHVPLDKRHDCVACSHLSWRVATTFSHLAGQANALGFLFVTISYTDNTLQNYTSSSGTRGPPPSLV